MSRTAGLFAFLSLIVFATQHASADVLAYDYFDYGTTTGMTLGGLGSATNGFSGAWVDTATNTSGRHSAFDGSADETLEYIPATALTFSNPNYDSSRNAGGTIQQDTGTQLTYATTYRTFATSLSGTIWMSALVEFDGDSTVNDMLVWFNPSTNHWSGGNAVGFYSGNNDGTNSGSVVKYSGAYSTSADYYVSPGTTYLMLAKLDVTTGADSITLWMKTEGDDLSNEASLGTPLYALSGTNILGDTLGRIGISFGNGSGTFDALVFGETLQDVTMVPEPSTVVLLLSALVAAAVYRRRRR